jgi:hypothetical protein
VARTCRARWLCCIVRPPSQRAIRAILVHHGSIWPALPASAATDASWLLAYTGQTAYEVMAARHISGLIRESLPEGLAGLRRLLVLPPWTAAAEASAPEHQH